MSKCICHDEIHQSLLIIQSFNLEIVIQIFIFIHKVAIITGITLYHVEIYTCFRWSFSNAWSFIEWENIILITHLTFGSCIRGVNLTTINWTWNFKTFSPWNVITCSTIFTWNCSVVLVAIWNEVFFIDLNTEESTRVLVVIFFTSQTYSIDR